MADWRRVPSVNSVIIYLQSTVLRTPSIEIGRRERAALLPYAAFPAPKSAGSLNRSLKRRGESLSLET